MINPHCNPTVDPRLRVAGDKQPCTVCGIKTCVVIAGIRGHWACIGHQLPPLVVSSLSSVNDQLQRVDLQPAPVAQPAPAPVAQPKLLAALEGTCAPRKRIDGRMRAPYWRPELPAALELVQVVSSWSWKRPYAGDVAVLDRSGAWISAASSVDVAHGELEHTGDAEFTGRPGLYEVSVYPWLEDGLPNPLGRTLKGQETVWVPAPRVKLLQELAAAGRWPDAAVVNSYTGEPVRMLKWTNHVNSLRADAIRRHGRDSEEYDAVKVAFSQALSLMIGAKTPGQPRKWKCAAQRPDWTYSIQDQAAVTLWRWADACRQVAPELPPVAMRNVDELVIPRAALEIVTTTERPGGKKPLEIDPTGIKLGTFKLKEVRA